MSLIGPRPPLPSEVERYEPWHHGRLAVKPGLTGLWQVSGRSLLSFDQMVRLDCAYIARWSLALDARIALQTLLTLFFMRGAY
jgi:lipopolysaccharide/colanic/teichoic acid biosynthesis glycosyltransferase